LSRQGGEVERGLDTVEQAIGLSDEMEESWVRAKLLSVKGELLLLRGASRDAAAARSTTGSSKALIRRILRAARAMLKPPMTTS